MARRTLYVDFLYKAAAKSLVAYRVAPSDLRMRHGGSSASLHSYIQGTPSIERNVTLSYENEEMNQVESYSIGGGELVWVQTSYHQRPNYVIIAGYWVGNFQTDKGMVAFRENDTWFIEKPQTMMSMND